MAELLDLATLEPGFTLDPYPTYERLRRHAPVRRVVLHGLSGWLVTGYAEARQALADPALSNDRANASEACRDAHWLFADEVFDLQHHMLRSDPPRHGRIRRLAGPAFSAANTARLRPRIQQIADELVDAFAPRGHAELIAEYAFPLPLLVIMEILGIPGGDRAQLRAWSDLLSSGRAATAEAVTATLREMTAYLRDLLRCADRPDGLLATLAKACYEDGELSEPELLSSAFQLLQGGHVTTLGLIANGVTALLRHPDQLDAMRAGRAGNAVDELLRYDPPMEVATVRFTVRPTRIGDTEVPGGGEPVLIALAAANRDPARFVRAGELDLGRDSAGHLAFAAGPHHCLGAHLARAEAQIAFGTLLRRLDGLRLAVPFDQLVWRPNPHLRRPERLPVTFGPAP
jgi:cytochrome P450